jgi:hypothetical protein
MPQPTVWSTSSCNGARRWTAGRVADPYAVETFNVMLQWSPPLDGGTSLAATGAGTCLSPPLQWSPPLDGGTRAREIRTI